MTNTLVSKEPPCIDCIPPALSGNQEALFIWNIVRNQYIMGFGGPIDLSHVAIWEAIDRYNIEDKITVFEKVLVMGAESLNIFKEKADEEEEKRKHQ